MALDLALSVLRSSLCIASISAVIAKPIGPQVRIRDLREAHGISVKELVEKIAVIGEIEIHENAIRNIESGHRRGSVPLMTAWAIALGIRPIDVYQEPLRGREGDA